MNRQRAIHETLYRDPVHGLLTLNRASKRERLLVDLIDAAEVQRLRRVRQLGLAYMVYQGAEHSRFSHVMGVMHLMGMVLRQLRKGFRFDAEEIVLGQAAALLHDVGHGPFSHVFERFMKRDHEDWTQEIILSPGTEVHAALSAYSVDLPARIVDILHTRRHRPRFLTDLISSQLDVDRFDYLMRDGLMTGVKHGVFDLDRLVATLRIHPTSERIVVHHKGIFPLEKYLHARYYMYRQVYQHKTVVAAEAMLTALMRRLRDLLSDKKARAAVAGDLPAGLAGLTLPPVVVRVLASAKEAITLGEYLMLDDTVMYYTIGELRRAPDPIVADLARRLLGRRLFKTLRTGGQSIAPERLAAMREALERRGLDPTYYLLEINSSGVGYAPYQPNAKDRKHIDIELADGSYHEAAEVSEVIAALTRLKYDEVQYCYPAETPDGRSIRREVEAAGLGEEG